MENSSEFATAWPISKIRQCVFLGKIVQLLQPNSHNVNQVKQFGCFVIRCDAMAVYELFIECENLKQ